MVVIISHPLAVFAMVSWFGYKVAIYPEHPPKHESDHDDGLSGTEPPSETESSKCQAYQIQLLRDKYRLLVDAPCETTNVSEMYVIEFDSVAVLLDGVEVEVSLPTMYLCRAHQHLYQTHVETNTCSDIGCVDRGFINVTTEGQPIMACVQHMKSRPKQEGVGK